jgi:hypothetical protein
LTIRAGRVDPPQVQAEEEQLLERCIALGRLRAVDRRSRESVQREHRAVPRDTDREPVPADHLGDTRPEPLAARCVHLGRVCGVELAERDAPGRHRGDVVVEGARVRDRARPGGVELVEQLRRAAERAEREPSADVLAVRPDVRSTPSSAVRPERPGEVILVGDTDRAGSARRVEHP